MTQSNGERLWEESALLRSLLPPCVKREMERDAAYWEMVYISLRKETHSTPKGGQ